LCEYVQHLAIFNYIAISATLEDHVCEFVDHLHEHFVDPCVVKNARYVCPTVPGYSITMKPQSLDDHEFPNGKEWRS
jgi:L-fuconate dehydratase